MKLAGMSKNISPSGEYFLPGTVWKNERIKPDKKRTHPRRTLQASQSNRMEKEKPKVENKH